MLSKGKQFVNDMIRCRGMDWVRLGMKVEVCGKMGTIRGMNSSTNLDVVFEGKRYRSNCHPFWETRYFDKKGNVIKDYRKDKDND